MIHMPTRTPGPIVIATLCLLSICAGGCTSVYHVVLQEMTLCEREALSDRVTAARDNQVGARNALETAWARADALSETNKADEATRRRLRQSINRVELELWNMQRRIAGLEDAADVQLAALAENESDAGQTELARRYNDLVIQMHDSQRLMNQALHGLRNEAALAQANIDPEMASSLQPVAMFSRAERASLLDAIDEVILSADGLLAMLSGERPVTDRARDRAAAR